MDGGIKRVRNVGKNNNRKIKHINKDMDGGITCMHLLYLVGKCNSGN